MTRLPASDPLPPGRPWAGATVAVLGLGRSGRAACHLLRGEGVAVLAYDDRDAGALGWPDPPAGVELVLGGGEDSLPRAVQALVLSPGVPPQHALVRAAEGAGIAVLGELELATRRLRGRCIAVTGTNGKSTVVSLVYHLLQGAGQRSYLAGNIGTPLSELVGGIGEADVAVLECSSFQLERIRHFHPQVAAILNVAPDHLDRYADLAAYRAAKSRVLERLGPGDFCVLPRHDEALVALAARSAARALWFDAGSPIQGEGAWAEGGRLCARWQGQELDLLGADELPLLGAHNLANSLAATCCVLPFGLTPAQLREGLGSFRALPHRCELVAEAGGVRWVDDSKATNVHAALTAVAGTPAPVVWLLGGSGKGEDYAPLREGAGRARLAVCFGAEGAAIAAALDGALPVERSDDLRGAVAIAARSAREGDTVLLSPACASFDEFPGFAARGDAYAALAREYAKGGS